ncbi:MAG: leucine-rich repeat domain-containing protein [Fluviicola sp.]
MKKQLERYFLIYSILFLSFLSNAQDSLKVYKWNEVKKANSDTVFAIDASGLKWDSLPKELYRFTELKYLNISKNKITNLPIELGQLKKMEVFIANKNKILNTPLFICQMPNLRRLLISRNQITRLPDCIGLLKKLAIIDIWDNPIAALPEDLVNCSSLRLVDLRGIMFNAKFQEKWTLALPNVNWKFDPPCNCLD